MNSDTIGLVLYEYQEGVVEAGISRKAEVLELIEDLQTKGEEQCMKVLFVPLSGAIRIILSSMSKIIDENQKNGLLGLALLQFRTSPMVPTIDWLEDNK